MGFLIGQKVFCLLLISLCIQTVYSVAPLIACPASNPDRYEQRGEITSPNYPDEYPSKSQCKWRIYYDPGEVVTISFQVFSVEETDGGDCTSDYLMIEEKTSSKTYCGYERPAPYISDPNNGARDIIIRFESDEQVEGTGFLLEYYKSQQDLNSCPDEELEFLCQNHRCIPRDWLCNGMDECGDRSDEAVDVCQSAPSVFPVTGIPDCPSHTIYCLKTDGTTPQCLPEDKKCDGNQDCYYNEDELGCQVTCVHEMPPPSGSFSSPNYPNNYQNNLDCSWTLIVTEGNIIQLRFVDFDIEDGYRRDYVTVYDGGSISADEIGTYYGYKSNPGHYPPSVIEGSSNRLYVTFVTDGNNGNTGFNATYQSKGDCIDGQHTCSALDSNCYAENERCDGKLTCLRGEDEQGCDGCSGDDIPCSSESPVRCYSGTERCNGSPHCPGKEDELDCPPVLCNGEYGLFLCGMGKCIKENWICDSNVDCPDGTDEMNCPMSPKVITAAVVGSIVCGLLLVAALSCTCKLYQLYHSDPHPPTHTSPLSEIEDELMRREAPPSYTASMSSPHFDEAQRAFIESLQAAAQARGGNRGIDRFSHGRVGRRRNNSQPDSGDPPQQNRPSSPDSVNTTQDTISTTDSTTVSPPNGTETNQQNPPSSEVADDGSSPYTEISEIRENPNLTGDTASSCTTDTDSDTNAEAELEQRDHDIIRAATNIRRMRLAGGIQTIVDTVTNRQREGAANADGETRRRSSSGLQNIIQRVNRTRENQQRGEGENSAPNSPTGVAPPTLGDTPDMQESSFTSEEEDHSPEQDNVANHHSTSSADGSDVAQDTAERNTSMGASEHTPSSNSPQPPPSPSQSSKSDDAPIDLSNTQNDEDSCIIEDDDDETMLIPS